MMDPSYEEKINQLRVERDRHMISNPLNWFSLIGLFPLKDGDNTYGSGDLCDIHITKLPHKLSGGFQLTNGKVIMIGTCKETTVNGRIPVSRPLHADTDTHPDLVEIGSIAMMVLKRGKQRLLRVWDKDAAAVKTFSGLQYYPVNPDYRVNAVFTPYDPPKQVNIIDVIGTENTGVFIGQVRFSLHGVDCSLEAEDAKDELLFSFTDETKIDGSYPGGRLLTVPKPPADEVVLDFNLAANWPCAYTPFATCPIPPAENRLSVRIEAGEMKYHD